MMTSVFTDPVFFLIPRCVLQAKNALEVQDEVRKERINQVSGCDGRCFFFTLVALEHTDII